MTNTTHTTPTPGRPCNACGAVRVVGSPDVHTAPKARKFVRLSCGDLEGMDAMRLRGLLAYAIVDTSRGSFEYVDGIAGRIARLTGLDRFDIINYAAIDAGISE